MTNNSIFTRVLALMLCLIMLVGTLTACFNEVDPENNVGTTTNGGVVTTNPTTKPTTTTPTTPTTGDVVEDNPVEDPVEPVDPNEIFSASTNISSDGLIYGTLASDVVIGGTEMGALVPADVKVEAGASNLALSVKKVDEVLLSDALSTLDVHINGVALDNTVPMIVKLGAILEAGLGATELKLYHTENGVDNLMTRVSDVTEFAIHNQYYYNAETGEVTIYVASFSVFTAVKSTADVWTGESDTTWYVGNEDAEEYTLNSAEQFAGFRDLVDSGVTFAGKTVKLGVDIDLKLYKDVVVKNEDGSTTTTQELVSFDPIGKGYVHNGGQAFMGTFDGQGHTIYNLYQNGWDLGYSYSTVGGGLFASIKDATIKNLAVSGANIVMECIDMGTVVGYAQGKCTFENIVVTNSKLANYQRYTGGVVGEVCKGDGIEDTYTHTFTNVTVDSSVKISSLWGDFDNACGGVIGGKWGTARVLMQNVTVACEIDAFSDVTAAYQWYAYRRCGMLIGHTEQNSPKSALNAAAEFLTCENVNVYYGDWVNYTYYQFANQTDDAGTRLWNSNYPWVRAEAGEYNGAFSNVRYGNPIIKGEKINTVERAKELGAPSVTIIFNQLYGGGQGVYGAADHNYNGGGVTIHNSLTKTVYIQNNLNWNNLKLHYWFANGDDRWTTVVEGIALTVENGVCKLEIPAYADGFKITGMRPNNAAVFSTPEISLSEVDEKYTYPLNAFYWTLTINGTSLDVIPGKLLYNTQVNTSNVPKAQDYDVIIYDKNYTGTFTTNDYGVAIVLDANGKLVKIYDGANVGYYTESGKVSKASLTASNYATLAFSELTTGETLMIFPNDGAGNHARSWALNLRKTDTNAGSLGKNMTVKAGIHVCENVCDTCGGCTNWNCFICDVNRCKCLTITVGDNKFTATEGNWIYNTEVSSSTASKYDVIVYDKNYKATFATNGYGVVLVIDSKGKLVKAYDAANGDGAVYYYDAQSNKVAINIGGNTNYATVAFEALSDGETLIVLPNDGGNNVARNWAKNLCANIGTTATLTTPAGLTKTIYFQNNWKWTEVRAYYWFEDAWHNISWPGVTPTKISNDGTYDIYKIDVPANATGLIISGINNDGSGTRTQTQDIDATKLVEGDLYSVHYNGSSSNSNKNEVTNIEYRYGYKIVYLTPNNIWELAGARFAVYAFISDSDNVWISLTDEDGDGTYSAWIPTKYTKIVFCRMNGSNSANNWDNVWNKTNDLTGIYYGYSYTVNGNIYMKPNSNWKESNAWFAARFWDDKGKEQWVKMTDADKDGTYECEVPEGMNHVIIVRMNPAKTLNDKWNGKWNQTGDLTIFTDGRNYFEIPSGWWDSMGDEYWK